MRFDDLTDANFLMFAMKEYTNQQCTNIDEFYDDLKKIKYIKRLINRFLESGKLKEILILNHLIVFYNVFDNKAATRLLFFKIEDKYWSVLKTFLIYLSMMPEIVKGVRGEDIISSDIQLNQEVIDKLRDFDGRDT
jgi:hypothetical protein